jgi:hypothetical protein
VEGRVRTLLDGFALVGRFGFYSLRCMIQPRPKFRAKSISTCALAVSAIQDLVDNKKNSHQLIRPRKPINEATQDTTNETVEGRDLIWGINAYLPEHRDDSVCEMVIEVARA